MENVMAGKDAGHHVALPYGVQPVYTVGKLLEHDVPNHRAKQAWCSVRVLQVVLCMG